MDGCPLKGARGAKLADASRDAEDKAKRKADARADAMDQIEAIAKRQTDPMQKTAFVETVMGRLGIGKDSARAYVAALLNEGRLIEKAEPEKNNRKLMTAPVVMEQGKML